MSVVGSMETRPHLVRVSCAQCSAAQFVLSNELAWACVYCGEKHIGDLSRAEYAERGGSAGYDAPRIRRVPWWVKWGATIAIGFALGELLKVVGVIK